MIIFIKFKCITFFYCLKDDELDEIDKKKAKKIKAMESDDDDDEGMLYFYNNFTRI